MFDPLPVTFIPYLETVRDALADLNGRLLDPFDAILGGDLHALDQAVIDALSDAFLTLFLGQLDDDWEPNALGVAYDEAIGVVNGRWIEHNERTP